MHRLLRWTGIGFGSFAGLALLAALGLRGDPRGGTPDLIAAAAYAPPDFERLIRTGVPLGDVRSG